MKMAVVRGVMDQMRMYGGMNNSEIGSMSPMEVNEAEIMEEYWDDINGEILEKSYGKNGAKRRNGRGQKT